MIPLFLVPTSHADNPKKEAGSLDQGGSTYCKVMFMCIDCNISQKNWELGEFA